VRWWGGEDIATSACAIDLRVGGTFSYHMRSKQGREYRCACIYREVDEPRRLVFTNRFVDAQGNPVPHPDLPAWPRETLVALTFSEEGGKTRVTLEQSVIDGTDAENEAFSFARNGSLTFWNSTLDRLVAELA
jgi:uncharacterized protein YndB with AHSA1/START domain